MLELAEGFKQHKGGPGSGRYPAGSGGDHTTSVRTGKTSIG